MDPRLTGIFQDRSYNGCIAIVFSFGEIICKFRLRNASIPFALFTVLSMCLFDEKSGVKVMPSAQVFDGVNML